MCRVGDCKHVYKYLRFFNNVKTFPNLHIMKAFLTNLMDDCWINISM